MSFNLSKNTFYNQNQNLGYPELVTVNMQNQTSGSQTNWIVYENNQL